MAVSASRQVGRGTLRTLELMGSEEFDEARPPAALERRWNLPGGSMRGG